MGEVYSPHGGTFSEGVPSVKIEESVDILEKCPSCDSDNCMNNECLDCGLGYNGELLNAIIKPGKEIKDIIKIFDDPYDSKEKGFNDDSRYFSK